MHVVLLEVCCKTSTSCGVTTKACITCVERYVNEGGCLQSSSETERFQNRRLLSPCLAQPRPYLPHSASLIRPSPELEPESFPPNSLLWASCGAHLILIAVKACCECRLCFLSCISTLVWMLGEKPLSAAQSVAPKCSQSALVSNVACGASLLIVRYTWLSDQ